MSKTGSKVRNFILNRKFILDIEKLILRGKTKKDVLFLVLNEIMFSYVHPIYEKLKNDKRLRLWFCFYSPRDFKRKNLSRIKKEYKTRSISASIAKYLNWDLILYPFHGPEFRKSCRRIYITHSLKSGKRRRGHTVKYGPKTRDEQGDIIYDKIFTANEHEKEFVRTHFPEYYPRVHVVGSLLVDELVLIASQRDNILRRIDLDANRKTIMVISTWGEYSFAQNLGLEFIDKISAILKKYNIILSLHQNNFIPRLSQNINWQKIFAQTHRKNLYILRNNEHSIGFLPAADILLTDHTSTGLFYLFLERPIIFYDNGNVDYDAGALISELRKVAYAIHDLQDFERSIQKGFAQFDAAKIKQLASKACSYLGHAWERYEAEIYDSLSLKKYSEI